MINLYRTESSDPKLNAERNLQWRTHYVDALRAHKSRILHTKIAGGGLLFALVESYATDPNNGKRLFRPVVFDVFGGTVCRPSLDEGFRTRKLAEAAMREALSAIDAVQVTEAAINAAESAYAREIRAAREQLAQLSAKKESTR